MSDDLLQLLSCIVLSRFDWCEYLPVHLFDSIFYLASPSFTPKPALAKVGEEIAALQATAAAEAAEAAAKAAAEDGEGGEAPAGLSELLKPYKEAEAVLEQVWNLAVSASGVANGEFCDFVF